jgi:DNA-binding winged helix-turn-helix (wHTH) protein
MQTKTFKILVFLAKHEDRIVKKIQLINLIWIMIKNQYIFNAEI